MKFWELMCVMRNEDAVLETVLQLDEWREYYKWYQAFSRLVSSQDRKKLDATLPEALIKDVLGRASLRYYLDETSFPGSSILRGRRANDADTEISALTAYERYGGTVLEDTLEKGSCQVSCAFDESCEPRTV